MVKESSINAKGNNQILDRVKVLDQIGKVEMELEGISSTLDMLIIFLSPDTQPCVMPSQNVMYRSLYTTIEHIDRLCEDLDRIGRTS